MKRTPAVPPRSSQEEAHRIVDWLTSPKGKRAVEKNLTKARKTIAFLRKKRHVPASALWEEVYTNGYQ